MSVFTDRNHGLEPAIDIEERVRIQLQHSPYRAIRRVTCRFDNGELTLEGRVPTFHYKQLAQTAVAGIAGVKSIINEITVEDAP
jgi:osmotically-inducible protein OsmY